MVYAFIIHTLFPGPCKVLFNQIYGSDDISGNDGDQPVEEVKKKRQQRKKQIQFVASQVHSENLFRRSVTGRTLEEDIQAISQEDQLPEFELGFFRLKKSQLFVDDKVVVWFGAGNTGFTLILHKEENRVLAENVLKLLIKYFQEYLRVLNQPAEAALKADRVCLILHKFLPDGSLIFMNHRVVRAIERELEIVVKS
ncbi:AP-5 complex subunit sigma-1-like [Mercenaria mercenaria]|uniref:AP-5 complex subunit sigma-1-like n=1 Tax=Mercenaria mercenaria TaxID=6596 RepID=UPI00234F294E|nr:AP-5 complex subunit sigma-1-like [Mercenaria mercenaria]